MTTNSGSAITYATVAAGAPVSVWLTTAEGILGLTVGLVSLVVLIVRLIIDWPKLRARLRRKGDSRVIRSVALSGKTFPARSIARNRAFLASPSGSRS